jgi:secondary thiamine-phosphate synthase enzyme
MVRSERFGVSTRGDGDLIDLTGHVRRCVASSGITNGVAVVFVPGSTAGVTTIEYEPGLAHDFPEMMERIAPRNIPYRHHERWGDDNGHAHCRASLLGPSVSIPFQKGELLLGTWQQIVLVDFDTRPRQREVVVQILGE